MFMNDTLSDDEHYNEDSGSEYEPPKKKKTNRGDSDSEYSDSLDSDAGDSVTLQSTENSMLPSTSGTSNSAKAKKKQRKKKSAQATPATSTNASMIEANDDDVVPRHLADADNEDFAEENESDELVVDDFH